jgi:hypothetical protein
VIFARRFVAPFLAVSVLTSWGVSTAFAINWGKLDAGAHPNVGALVQVARLAGTNPTLPIPRIRGSGSLIHSSVFLSAGHVTAVLDGLIELNGPAALDAFRVSFGDNALDPATWHEIDLVVTHPGYRSGLSNASGAAPMIDVGVLVLKARVENIKPVTLAPEGFLDALRADGVLRHGRQGGPFTSVGYGTQLEWPPPTIIFPDGLRRSAVSGYMALIDHWLILSQNQAIGNGGTGLGDSGGPTFWIDPATGTEVVVAVTSRGDPKTVATGFAFRTDISGVLDFLDLVMLIVGG